MGPSLPNWQRVTPLHYIAAGGGIDKAKLFLEFGADANAIDEEYRTRRSAGQREPDKSNSFGLR